MIALLQRVTAARVEVEDRDIASIGAGLLVLVGVERQDSESAADRLAERLVAYRIFADEADRMNLSVREVGGSVLLVPQFTLAADTSGGLRPSFSAAAPPARAAELFERLAAGVRASGVRLECGRFGAHMRVTLTNDGPVTFRLEA